jgi:hypothetical protein
MLACKRLEAQNFEKTVASPEKLPPARFSKEFQNLSKNSKRKSQFPFFSNSIPFFEIIQTILKSFKQF